jgi:hypothetical protein
MTAYYFPRYCRYCGCNRITLVYTPNGIMRPYIQCPVPDNEGERK